MSIKEKNILAGEEKFFCRPTKKNALIIGNLPLLDGSSLLHFEISLQTSLAGTLINTGFLAIEGGIDIFGKM